MTAIPQRRPTIAFLLDNLFDDYEETLWRSVVEAAREEDVSLLCFVGGSLTPAAANRESWARNALFDLVHPCNVDGIILLATSVGIFLEDEELDQFAARFAPIPLVGLGRGLKGWPHLDVDNGAGVRDLMDHLIEHHGRRRIAFIRGPATNNEAEERFLAYRTSLERHGLAYDPALVAMGDFNRGSGMRAIQTLLDERRVRPDAVVAANDLMALYAMKELAGRGLNVPRDVAVTGFDDVADGASALPALTTVRQPLEEIGRAAVRRLVSMLRGAHPPATERLAARPVIRRSCGCLPVLGRWSTQAEAAPDGGGPTLATVLTQAFPELSLRLGSAAWADELAAAFPSQPQVAPDALLQALERLIIQGMERGLDPMRFYDLIHAMLRSGPAAALPGARLAVLAESCTQLVGTMAAHAQAGVRVRAAEEAKIFQYLFQPLHVTEDAFESTLVNELPTLGARSFFLCRYGDPEGRTAVLRAHYDLSGRLPLAGSASTEPFPASQLIPGGLRHPERQAHAVLAVHYLNERIGYMVCELGGMSPAAYEGLTTQVSAVLKFTQLVAAVRQQASDLEEKVEARTRELRSAQRQLLETAHQAGMAEVSVGVLHNVGNLLNSVSVCAEEIAAHASSPHAEGLRRGIQLLADHRHDLAAWVATDPKATLLPDYLERIGGELLREQDRSRDEAQELLEKISVIRDTIRALQDLARHGRQSVLRERVDVPGLVDAVLEIQRPLLHRHGVRLHRVVAERLPSLLSERAKLIQVLVNLVKNAVEAMRAQPAGERLLTVAAHGDVAGRLRIEVSDTGEGIAAENLERIFSFGFTTKQDGHGFGLHTCALHAHQLGGTLEARSPGPGHGATFTLTLPAEGTA